MNELEQIVNEITDHLLEGYCPACGETAVKEYKTFFFCRSCGWQVWKEELPKIAERMRHV